MTLKKEIIILGGGGTSKDIISIINDINSEQQLYKCVGILDDNKLLWGSEVLGVKVLGPIDEVTNWNGNLINALGGPCNFKIRKNILSNFNLESERFETIIHPKSSVSKYAKIDSGVIVFPNVVVMSDVKIGKQVLVLSSSVINHDVIIGDYSILTSGVNISGGVTLGENCYIGTGSSLIQNLKVGNEALIGMGSTVIDNVSDRAVVVGNPAKAIISRK